MAKLEINPQGTEEIFEIYLDPVKHPIAYSNKMDELMSGGMTYEEADKFLKTTAFVVEVYYSTDQGLFLIESEAVESTDIYNPYDGKAIHNPEKNQY